MNSLTKTLVLFSYDFPPSTGGIARLCKEIVSHSIQYYHHIEVITIKKDGPAKTFIENDNISVTYLPPQRGLTEWAALKKLRSFRAKDQIDVLCGLWHPEGALALLAGMENIFVLAHGAELLAGNNYFRKYLWHPLYAKWVLGKADKIIANSNYTRQLVTEINERAKVRALPLGVDTEFFRPTTNQEKKTGNFMIVTVSRILHFKGHDFVLKALEQLPNNIKQKIEWHIAGRGPYLKELKNLVSQSTVKDQVVFHDFVPDKILPSFYNMADVFILATRMATVSNQVEGFGLVFLEAQASGIPVIGTRTGGIPDAIEDENGGWLIDQDNSKQLQDILERLIINPDIQKNEGRNARIRVEESYTWQSYVTELQKIINDTNRVI
ncbi:MAG: hypothetical protein CMC08_01945 [Flavobacteriaceae bacterium]|nr:hypothetical protein [Flavobacteriaceae bacterium]